MNRLVAIALLTWPAAAMAQSASRWVQLGRDFTGSIYEVDLQRSQIAGNLPIVLIRVASPEVSGVRATRLMIRVQIDCALRRSSVLPITNTRTSGTSGEVPQSDDWQDIIPGSTMERFARDICQVAQGRR